MRPATQEEWEKVVKDNPTKFPHPCNHHLAEHCGHCGGECTCHWKELTPDEADFITWEISHEEMAALHAELEKTNRSIRVKTSRPRSNILNGAVVAAMVVGYMRIVQHFEPKMPMWFAWSIILIAFPLYLLILEVGKKNE